MSAAAAAPIAGVIGWPVAHSLSPRLHGHWLREHALPGRYVALPVRPEHLDGVLRSLPRLGYRGCNITVPHKQAALGLLDRVDAAARRIGAVNTVVVAPDGTLEGGNSDGFGFLENLRSGRPGWSAAAGPAVVLGAGGSARAVVAALLDDGAPEVRLINRDRGRAERLAADLGGAIEVHGWDRAAAVLEGAALLVNCTSLGMRGQPSLDLDLKALPGQAVVTDLVYAPLRTGLLAAAAARGNPCVDGLGMLLHQGRPGFRAWFGVDPQVTASLRRAVLG